jgi:hypothetical protein
VASKLLIGISAQGATVAHWRGKRIAECEVFAGDESGYAAFREYLAACEYMPASLMVDTVEEDYRFETLPHAFGSDRAQMVDRKLRQHYRNTPYVTSWLLGRDSSKRRDDRFLFSALTNPDLIDEWLKAVIARGLPVAGIYLLPMVSAALPQKLDIKAGNLLIVAQHSGGLRLTFFRDRQFRLSRLTRGDSGRSSDRARFFGEEISNTRLYLHALRTMTLDEQLTVLLLDRQDDLVDVAAAVARDNPSVECVRLGRNELATRVGVSESLLDVSPYVIYLQLLGLGAPQSNLAPASVTVGYRRHQARRGIYGATAAIALGAAVWAGADLVKTWELRGEEELAARETAQLSAQYQQITRQFPAAPASAESLKRTVEIAQRLREDARTPRDMMSVISRALQSSPTVVIKEFGWKYGTSEISAGNPGARTEEAAQPAAPTLDPRLQLKPGLARKQSALIGGEVRPFRGNYRGAIEIINGFADRIAKDPLVADVRVVKLPLNVNPTLQLSGNTLDVPERQTGTADFELLVVFKPNV